MEMFNIFRFSDSLRPSAPMPVNQSKQFLAPTHPLGLGPMPGGGEDPGGVRRPSGRTIV